MIWDTPQPITCHVPLIQDIAWIDQHIPRQHIATLAWYHAMENMVFAMYPWYGIHHNQF